MDPETSTLTRGCGTQAELVIVKPSQENHSFNEIKQEPLDLSMNSMMKREAPPPNASMEDGGSKRRVMFANAAPEGYLYPGIIDHCDFPGFKCKKMCYCFEVLEMAYWRTHQYYCKLYIN